MEDQMLCSLDSRLASIAPQTITSHNLQGARSPTGSVLATSTKRSESNGEATAQAHRSRLRPADSGLP
eukprot:7537145-Alexandrium_andersonii.AAC.1